MSILCHFQALCGGHGPKCPPSPWIRQCIQTNACNPRKTCDHLYMSVGSALSQCSSLSWPMTPPQNQPLAGEFQTRRATLLRRTTLHMFCRYELGQIHIKIREVPWRHPRSRRRAPPSPSAPPSGGGVCLQLVGQPPHQLWALPHQLPQLLHQVLRAFDAIWL